MTALDELQNTIDKIETLIAKNRIVLAEEPKKNNMQLIADIWHTFFIDLNRANICIENKELTPTEILLTISSFREKFNVIERLAQSEIIARERKRTEML